MSLKQGVVKVDAIVKTLNLGIGQVGETSHQNDDKTCVFLNGITSTIQHRHAGTVHLVDNGVTNANE